MEQHGAVTNVMHEKGDISVLELIVMLFVFLIFSYKISVKVFCEYFSVKNLAVKLLPAINLAHLKVSN